MTRPLMRLRAAMYCNPHFAEYFRDQGKNVPVADGFADPFSPGAAGNRPLAIASLLPATRVYRLRCIAKTAAIGRARRQCRAGRCSITAFYTV